MPSAAPAREVDTYDTSAGAGKVIGLAEELGDTFSMQAVRLYSGRSCRTGAGRGCHLAVNHPNYILL